MTFEANGGPVGGGVPRDRERRATVEPTATTAAPSGASSAGVREPGGGGAGGVVGREGNTRRPGHGSGADRRSGRLQRRRGRRRRGGCRARDRSADGRRRGRSVQGEQPHLGPQQRPRVQVDRAAAESPVQARDVGTGTVVGASARWPITSPAATRAPMGSVGTTGS